MSMSGALAYRPDRSEAAFVFAMKEGTYNTGSLVVRAGRNQETGILLVSMMALEGGAAVSCRS